MLGDVNKLFVFKSLLTMPSNVLPLHRKQTFSAKFWIFTEGEGDGIECRLSSINLFYFNIPKSIQHIQPRNIIFFSFSLYVYMNIFKSIFYSFLNKICTKLLYRETIGQYFAEKIMINVFWHYKIFSFFLEILSNFSGLLRIYEFFQSQAKLSFCLKL